MFKTLYSRILWTYLTVSVGAVALLGLALGLVFKNELYGAREEQLWEQGAEAASLAGQYALMGSLPEEGRAILLPLARSADGVIELYYAGGGVERISSGDAKWGGIEEEGPPELLAGLLSGSHEAGIGSLYALSIPTLTYYAPVNGGAVLLSVDVSPAEARLQAANIWTACLCGAMAAILAVLIAHSAKGIAAPAREMNGVVKRFNKGDFSMRVNSKGSDELAQIGKNFNRMADTLTTLEESRRTFVANVSHELRSPLTSMQGFLEAILDGTIPPEEHEHYLNIVVSENKRMTTMVNDLLDLSRIESGQNAVKLEPFDINDLIVRSLLTFEARILAKNIDVDVSFAQDRSFVLADQDQIAQIIRNLVDNAIKFTPEGGMLRITTALGKRLIAVSVKDSGEGIAREDIPYVFDRFYKGEKAHTPSGTASTGLGLAIVKKILDQHGQSIRVDSTLGKGTCFTFTLKRTAEPVPRKKSQQEADDQ